MTEETTEYDARTDRRSAGRANGRPNHEPLLVTLVKRLEATTALNVPVSLLRPLVAQLTAKPEVRSVLLGRPLGHAVHPVITDLPLGFWTSASVLDLVGGRQSRPAAARLLALGLVAAVPTIATGLAEWGESAGDREKRVGIVHAGANSVALGCYTASLLARWRGRHLRGVALALSGGAAAGVGGYLGGHLTSARKVSSRDPAFTP